jgi:lysophospholipase L1-like esterase
VYFEGRFHGTGVGVVLNDNNNDYDVQVDGATVAKLLAPGQTTYWVNNLSNADHTVRLVKRTESPWASGQFGGFVAASGGSILSKPSARTRQIEFIGDSFTAGYGNQSTSHDCSSTGGVSRNSDADVSFGALTARALGADYQLNAWSGLGMVRNYGGQNTSVSFRAYYDQTLQAYYQSQTYTDGSWRPQVVVVGLGINDFSTALTSGEKWADQAALVADYKSAYQGFLDKLRSKYGSNTYIVVSATSYGGSIFPTTAQQVVQDRNSAGDSKVVFWDYSNASLNFLGCDWHPSAQDDVTLASILTSYLNNLPLSW